MLSVLSHQGNANQITLKYRHSQLVPGQLMIKIITSVGKAVEKLEPSCFW